MIILIIEDDENKQVQIRNLISKMFSESKILLAKSYHSGLLSILDNSPDLILLDMTMPTYDIDTNEDGGRPQHFAGREILRQMDRRKVNIPVIIITQFDVFGDGPNELTRTQLDNQLRRDHSRNYQGTVYYNAANNAWERELQDRLMCFSGGE
jgi:CheY-like chemotaxis protein